MNRFDRRFPDHGEFGDVTNRLPVPNASARLVYCSHVLEHLPLEGWRAALRETYRVLQSGGIFGLLLPDLASIVDAYRSDPNENAAGQFMRDTILDEEARWVGWSGRLRNSFGNARHRWMWDFLGLSKEIRKATSVDICRAFYGGSLDSAFSEVEEESRWRGSLGIDCTKPLMSSAASLTMP